MAKPLRDISPKKPKEGDFSGKRSSTIAPPDIDDTNLYNWEGGKDGVAFIKKHKTEKHDYPYDAEAAFTSGKVKQTDMTKHGYKKPADAKVYEETEELDELSRGTLNSYAQKADSQLTKVNANGLSSKSGIPSYYRGKNKDLGKDPVDKMRARKAGVNLAIKKLNAESKGMKCESCGTMYEGESCGCGGSSENKKGKKLLLGGKKLHEILTKKTPAGKVISDFVHSDNPKFAGKSKEERKRMALGAYYGMHPEKSKKVEEEVEQVDEAQSARQKAASARAKSKDVRVDNPKSNFDMDTHSVHVTVSKGDGAKEVMKDSFKAKDKHQAMFNAQMKYHKAGYKVHDTKHKGIINEDQTITFFESGKKKKEHKESAAADTQISFPSDKIGDVGRV